jgi:hypothetical protein
MRYTEQTAVRLDKETTAKLGRIAEAEDRSVSSVIRRMVADAVAAYKLPKKAEAQPPAPATSSPAPTDAPFKTTAPF